MSIKLDSFEKISEKVEEIKEKVNNILKMEDEICDSSELS